VRADEALLSTLRTAIAAAQAVPLRPVRVHNRLIPAVQAECDRLAVTSEGRDALAHAAERDPEPMVRLSAAVAVARWDADAGASALEALVVESGGRVVRPMTMTAALAVRGEPGRSAALCLLNIDRGVTPHVSRSRVAATQKSAVAAPLLDAAERVYGLAMNGGVEHAYEVAGDDFGAAVAGLDAVGASAAAHVLREALQLLTAARKEPSTAVVDNELARLDARLAGEDVMAFLEEAVES